MLLTIKLRHILQMVSAEGFGCLYADFENGPALFWHRLKKVVDRAPTNLATIILHHTPKSGANEKLCFAGAGASSLQRYVQTIARISQDKSGAYWFNALCREFDDPFKPVLLRKG